MEDPEIRSSEDFEERSQARARFAVCAIASLYLLGLEIFRGGLRTSTAAVVGFYAVFSLLWMLLIRRYPGRYLSRRILVILGDLGITTFYTYVLGAWGTVFYPIYLWIVVGNGVRFGPGYLLGAMGTALAYFAAVLYFSPFWRSIPTVGAALLIGLFALPIFFLSVVRRLHRANEQLAVALEDARAAGRAKDEFLANMSHELRTPMNGILGVSRLVQSTALDPQQSRYMRLMVSSARTLLEIINDVLDFSKIRAGKVSLEERATDLAEIVEDVCSVLQSAAAEKSLFLSWHIDPEASRRSQGDPTRIRQVLYNLVGNAIKFTDVGGVEVRYSSLAGEGGGELARFEVEDTGIGISEEDLELIFRQFEQAERRTSGGFGGTGLGLAISQRLVRLMGGDIDVRSKVGEGSRFTVTLPLVEPPESAAEGPHPEGSPSRTYGFRALVAEDNEISQIVAGGFLRLVGIESEIAADGEDAIRLHGERDFDLIFMDVQMPKVGGLEATRRIRSSATAGRDIPIIGLTANASETDRRVCREAGMDEHLKKPLTLEELIGALDRLVSSGRLPPPGSPP